MSPVAHTNPGAHVVIAVKRLDHAKTRLAAQFAPRERAGLVLAMLDDTLRAAADAPGIAGLTVVTPDPEVADVARKRGASVHPEPGDGLNAAFTAGAAHVRRAHGPVGVLALQADLPALRSAELAAALTSAPPAARAIVADHQGTGTCALLVGNPDSALNPAFGPDSARRHVAEGAIALPGDWPGLRLDVDTETDLRRALRLAACPATREFLTTLGQTQLPHPDLPLSSGGGL